MAEKKIKTTFTDSTTNIINANVGFTDRLGNKAWYVINTYSTHEKRVRDNLTTRLTNAGLIDLVPRIIVAEQEVEVVKEDGTVKKKTLNLYPGYVFIEMVMTDEAWFIVRNTPSVTGFVGSSGKGTKPFPVSREQIEPVLKRMGIVDNSMYDRYNVGDNVKVIHGPLEGTEGTITSINSETGAVSLNAIFFGRVTPVEVDFSEIEKINQ